MKIVLLMGILLGQAVYAQHAKVIQVPASTPAEGKRLWDAYQSAQKSFLEWKNKQEGAYNKKETNGGLLLHARSDGNLPMTFLEYELEFSPDFTVAIPHEYATGGGRSSSRPLIPSIDKNNCVTWYSGATTAQWVPCPGVSK